MDLPSISFDMKSQAQTLRLVDRNEALRKFLKINYEGNEIHSTTR